MNKTASILGGALLALSLSTPAQSEVIDLGTVKCSELATMSEDEAAIMMMWLHGYFSGKSGDTTMDTDAAGAAGAEIGKYCGENPEVSLLQAVNQLSQ